MYAYILFLVYDNPCHSTLSSERLVLANLLYNDMAKTNVFITKRQRNLANTLIKIYRTFPSRERVGHWSSISMLLILRHTLASYSIFFSPQILVYLADFKWQ